MKKGLSIILLVVFLFNVGGYYLVLLGVHFQRDRQLTQRLDADLYEAAETFQLKIPMTLPYPIYSEGFERVDGRFEHQGEYYRLIKQKLQNDTLYIVCLRDHGTREVVSMMIRYVHQTLGFDNSTPPQKALNFLSKFIKDISLPNHMAILQPFGFITQFGFPQSPETFTPPVIPVHAPPPRILC